jgi:hypothetical protein
MDATLPLRIGVQVLTLVVLVLQSALLALRLSWEYQSDE